MDWAKTIARRDEKHLVNVFCIAKWLDRRCRSMMTSSNGTIFRVAGFYAGNSHITGEFPAQRDSDAELWCFLWSMLWICGWVNYLEAGDLRCQRTHYNVIVMEIESNITISLTVGSCGQCEISCNNSPRHMSERTISTRFPMNSSIR